MDKQVHCICRGGWGRRASCNSFCTGFGEETREYLTGPLKQRLDGAASTGKRWTRRAQETVDDVKVKVAGAVEAGGKAYRGARDA